MINLEPIIRTLEGQILVLDAQAKQLHSQHGCMVEFADEDAQRLREAIELLICRNQHDTL